MTALAWRIPALVALSACVLAPGVASAAEQGRPVHLAYRIEIDGKLVAAPEIDLVPGGSGTMEIGGGTMKLRTAVSAGRQPGWFKVETVMSTRKDGTWRDSRSMKGELREGTGMFSESDGENGKAMSVALMLGHRQPDDPASS